MKRKIKITEQQAMQIKNMVLEQMDSNNPNNNNLVVTDQSLPDARNAQDVVNNLSNTKTKMKNNGLDKKANAGTETANTIGNLPAGTDIIAKPEQNQAGVNESIVITKKQLNEARLKILKKDSKLIKVKDFVR